jgi:hypothetical protein
MEKVIQASQNDFEESGVDQSTLEEMKQVCCNLARRWAVAPLSPREGGRVFSASASCFIRRLLASFSARCDDGAMAAWLWGSWAAESGAELPVGLAAVRGRLSIWVALL